MFRRGTFSEPLGGNEPHHWPICLFPIGKRLVRGQYNTSFDGRRIDALAKKAPSGRRCAFPMRRIETRISVSDDSADSDFRRRSPFDSKRGANSGRTRAGDCRAAVLTGFNLRSSRSLGGTFFFFLLRRRVATHLAIAVTSYGVSAQNFRWKNGKVRSENPLENHGYHGFSLSARRLKNPALYL